MVMVPALPYALIHRNSYKRRGLRGSSATVKLGSRKLSQRIVISNEHYGVLMR